MGMVLSVPVLLAGAVIVVYAVYLRRLPEPNVGAAQR